MDDHSLGAKLRALLIGVFSTPTILLALLIYPCGVIAFASWTVKAHRAEQLQRLDEYLRRAAGGVSFVLPPDFFERAITPTSLTPAEFEANQRRLQAYQSTAPDVTMLGTFRMVDGQPRCTSGTRPEQRYWSLNEVLHVDESVAVGSDPAPLFRTVFVDSGHRREVWLPVPSPSGNAGFVFAAADLQGINQQVVDYLPVVLLQGGFFLLLALPLLLAFGRFRARQQAALERAQLLAERARLREERIALEFLRFQLNPHFLFNALNSICALIVCDAGRAEEMTLRLSRFCRSSLFARNQHEVSLSENLAVIRDYLDIEAVRFEERLQVVFEVQIAHPEQILTPSFLLQPLLENAVKYGQRSGCEVLRIAIHVREEAGRLILEVTNSGNWFEPVGTAPSMSVTRFGLDNLRRRLEVYYGPGDYLRRDPTASRGEVRMRLTLPLLRSPL